MLTGTSVQSAIRFGVEAAQNAKASQRILGLYQRARPCTWSKLNLQVAQVESQANKSLKMAYLLSISTVKMADRKLFHGSWLATQHSCLAAQIAAVAAHPDVFSYDLPSHAQSVEMACNFSFKSSLFHFCSSPRSLSRLRAHAELRCAAPCSPASAPGNECCVEVAGESFSTMPSLNFCSEGQKLSVVNEISCFWRLVDADWIFDPERNQKP